MSTALTAHARKKWRGLGYFVEQGEHISRTGSIVRRHDTFGFADLLCLSARKQKPELVFLQVTSWGNVSARVNKIARESHGTGQWRAPIAEIVKDLLALFDYEYGDQYIRVVVEGWKLDKKTNRWISREVEITPELLKERAEK